MKYYKPDKKQSLPNGEIDKFLSQFHVLCKKHKMVLTSTDKKYPLVVREYSKANVQHMLGNVQNGIQQTKKEDESRNQTRMPAKGIQK